MWVWALARVITASHQAAMTADRRSRSSSAKIATEKFFALESSTAGADGDGGQGEKGDECNQEGVNSQRLSGTKPGRRFEATTSMLIKSRADTIGSSGGSWRAGDKTGVCRFR